MTSFLFTLHSGLRWAVMIAVVPAVLYLVWAGLTKRPWDRHCRLLMLMTIIVVDLQVLVGLLLLFSYPLAGMQLQHAVLMLAATVVLHVVNVMNKRRPEAQRSPGLAGAGVAVALALMVSGILVLGRPLFF